VTLDAWVHALEERHLHELQFREVSKALRALSSTYVERRHRVASGAALSSAGKRAAFALFYGPLHYLFVERVVDALGARAMPSRCWPISDAGPARQVWRGRRPAATVRGCTASIGIRGRCERRHGRIGISA
jgi:hypothetical protein